MPTPSKPRKLQKAFTIIELLTVIGIIFLLAGLAFPALRATGGKNLTEGGNLVADLANQARQNASAKGAMTALVLLKNTSDAQYNNRALVLVEKTVGATTWKPITRWNKLPEGVVVDATGSADFIDQIPNVGSTPDLPSFAGRTVNASDCAYQVFLPGGNLAPASVVSQPPPVLRLVEGTSDAGGPHPRNSQNYYDVVINLFTGIPKVDRP